jgi:hypothetical protein
VASALDLGVLRVWEPGADEVADLEEPSMSLATSDVQDRTGDLFGVMFFELPAEQCGQVRVEEREQIALHLLACARHVVLDLLAPVRADHRTEELVEGRGRAPAAAGDEQILVHPPELVGTGDVHRRGFDQDETAQVVGCVGRELEGHRAAVGQADNVGAFDAKRGQQSLAVCSIASDRAGPIDRRAAGVARRW